MTTNDQLLARTLGPRESEVLAWLESERRRSVTIDEAAAALGWSSKRTREVFARLARKGWLKRLARGRYETVLAETGGWTPPNPWAALSLLRQPYYVGFQPAAFELELTPDRPAEVQACPSGREAAACMGRRADRARLPADFHARGNRAEDAAWLSRGDRLDREAARRRGGTTGPGGPNLRFGKGHRPSARRNRLEAGDRARGEKHARPRRPAPACRDGGDSRPSRASPSRCPCRCCPGRVAALPWRAARLRKPGPSARSLAGCRERRCRRASRGGGAVGGAARDRAAVRGRTADRVRGRRSGDRPALRASAPERGGSGRAV